MPEELDTQELSEESTVVDQIEDEQELIPVDEEQEETLDLGLPAEDEEEVVEADTQQPQRLADIKELVKDGKVDEALTRIDQHEKGFNKVLDQKNEIQQVLNAFNGLIGQVKADNVEAVADLDAFLFEQTGWTLSGAAEFLESQGVTGKPRASVQEVPKNDPEVARIAKELAELKAERASQAWVAGVGSKVAAQVASKTGLTFSPEQIWLSKQHLKSGATVDDVIDAIMMTSPKVYREAVSKRDGVALPVPKSAGVPGKGTSAVTKANEPLTDGQWAQRRAAILSQRKG